MVTSTATLIVYQYHYPRFDLSHDLHTLKSIWPNCSTVSLVSSKHYLLIISYALDNPYFVLLIKKSTGGTPHNHALPSGNKVLARGMVWHIWTDGSCIDNGATLRYVRLQYKVSILSKNKLHNQRVFDMSYTTRSMVWYIVKYRFHAKSWQYHRVVFSLFEWFLCWRQAF